MKCCGVNNPEDYNISQLNYVIPPSCCGYSLESYKTNCSLTDSYKIGCYSRLIAYFQEYNQLIIWAGIIFNIFTVCRNISSYENVY